MKAAGKTDIGKVRLVNEDSFLVQSSPDGVLFAVVADGMGGHRAGDVASQMASELVAGQLQTLHRAMDVEQSVRLLEAAVDHANEHVFRYASAQESLQGMGTTVVAAIALKQQLLLAHIGDSRAYLASGGTLRQLTEDHSLVNELIRSGQITREEASSHPRRNVVTRALGTEHPVDIDLQQVDWGPGDVLLLCSDGLSGLVSVDRLSEIVHAEKSLEQKADELIGSALEAGGDDNITVVLLLNDGDEHFGEAG